MSEFVRVYRIAKFWAVFTYIAGGIMIVIFSGLLIMPFIDSMNNGSAFTWIFLPIALGMLTVMVIAILSTAKDRFVIEEDHVYYAGIFGTRKFILNEIKGFTVNDKYIVIEPAHPAAKRIKISKYFEGTGEIIDWLSKRYPDLQQREAVLEAKEILTDGEYGFTPLQRAARLKKARIVSRIVNIGGGAIAAWVYFYPIPYNVAIIATILVPVICILVMKRFGGLIRMDQVEKSPYPSVIWAMLFSSCAIFLRALLDFNFVTYDSLWFPSGLVAVACAASVLVTIRKTEWKKGKTWGTVICLLMLMFGYGYGTVSCVNAIGDKSIPQKFTVRVLDKRINSGETKSHYLTLEPWGIVRDSLEVQVPPYLYQATEVYDTVDVYLKQGLLGTPWFVVTGSVLE